MVKHIQTIRWQQPTNCLSVFDHFVDSALEGLISCHRKTVVLVCVHWHKSRTKSYYKVNVPVSFEKVRRDCFFIIVS